MGDAPASVSSAFNSRRTGRPKLERELLTDALHHVVDSDQITLLVLVTA